MPFIEKQLLEKNFVPYLINDSSFGGQLGQLGTNAWVQGNGSQALLLTCGVHGPEGVAIRQALNELMAEEGLFDEIPADTKVIIVPVCCPDSQIKDGLYSRDIPVYNLDGEQTDAWVDPNRACAPVDHPARDSIRDNATWLADNWNLIVPKPDEPPEKQAEKIIELRKRAFKDLVPTGAPDSFWQQAVAMKLIAGQDFFPFGLFYCDSWDLSIRHGHFTFLRDVLVPGLASLIDDRYWRGTDFHTGLPNAAFLVGGDKVISQTTQDLEVPVTMPPQPQPLFGENCMIVPDHGGTDFLSSLARECPTAKCLFGLEFMQMDHTLPWAPYPGAVAPLLPHIFEPETDRTGLIENIKRRRNGFSELDNMIQAAIGRQIAHHSGSEDHLHQALRRSQAYFGFTSQDHIDRLKRYIASAIAHHFDRLR